jgi:phosphoserine phosphatase RsbU/P
MACRTSGQRFGRPAGLLIAVLSIAASVALGLACPSTSAQSLDATNLRKPVEVGGAGLAQAGDDPAYALPGFDDSKWAPVNADSRLSEYFPHQQTAVVWQRLHVKVDPAQTGLAIQEYSVARAFEIYVNGVLLIQSGHVEPYAPYSRRAVLIVRIPEAQLQTGSLVIAVRTRATPSAWGSPSAAFDASALTLGEESVLRNQALLDVIGIYAEWVIQNLLGLGVALVALSLFSAHRQQREYLWVFVMGVLVIVQLPLTLYETVRNVPADWLAFKAVMSLGVNLSFVLIFKDILRLRFSRILWLIFGVSFLLDSIADIASYHGSISTFVYEIVDLPSEIVLAILLPLLLLRQLRRNREARILLIPLLVFSLSEYVTYALALMERIPALRAAGLASEDFVNSLHIGIFSIALNCLSNLCFSLSLAIIMVLRSNRQSRQQALLEGELEAAREVQQVILPEAVESVPGFTVESVYQPAQQVGGDFFQILPDNRGGLLIVVGDVAGKGLPAAMLVSVLVGAIRTVADDTNDPAVMLSRLNNRLVGRSHGGFSTALAAHITAEGWVSIANAGHLSPYLDGEEVELPGALPLGILSNAAYEANQFHLASGSRLTFYSDGVVEAQNRAGELFGFDRARDLSTKSAAEIVRAAKQFGQSDDITVVTIRRAAAIASAA